MAHFENATDNYQPIRIERELLAQVFDLAKRGLSGGLVRAEKQHGAADQTTDLHAEDTMQCDLPAQFTSEQVNELEAVA